ncbi:MAG: RHS repeat-associated core domain-containing protein [Vulcanimicrobiota bacterium]
MATGSSSELVRASYEYTGFSELKKLIRPKGASDPEFSFQYDRLGRPVTMTDPLNESSSTAYEPYCVGRAVTSARGVRTKMDFDTRCLLTQVTTGEAGSSPLDVSNTRITRTFEYDELGRMVRSTQSPNDIASPPNYGQARFGVSRYGQQAQIPNDGERLYEYDILDRLTKMTFEDDSEVLYLYDEASRLIEKTDVNGHITQYGYSKDHLLKTLTVKRDSQSDRVFTYHYNEAGRVTQVNYPGESKLVAYIDDGSGGSGWDKNGRLKHLRYELDGAPLRSFAYLYDPSGNRIQTTEVAGATTTVYKYHYDWLDRLILVEKGPSAGSVSPVSVYTYDESDNPTKLELPADFLEYDFTFDLASNITTRSETDTSASPVVNFTENFTSDEDGNLLTRTRTIGADTHQVVYEWDDFNKLVAVSASLNASPAAEPKQNNAYSVNGFRRQKVKKDGQVVTEYAEGLSTAVAKTQTETVTYIHGHQILGFERGGDFFYFVTDALGSVRDIINSSGTVVQQYEFDERGNHLISPMGGGPASPKTFVGGLSVNDDTGDSGLYLMGHRFYDPSLGRFLNRDPIGFAGGLNLFSYGGNNPVSRTDHSGLKPEHLMDRSVGIHHPDRAYIHPSGSFAAPILGMVFEPFDYAMMGYEIATEGFNPWMLLAALPVISWGLLKGVGTLFSKSEDCKSFALGLNKHLVDFAEKHGAEVWMDYLPTQWWDTVPAKLDDGKTRILFNQEGWSAEKAVEKLLNGNPGSTDTEFSWIRDRYKDIRTRVEWYNGSNPIEPGFNEF